MPIKAHKNKRNMVEFKISAVQATEVEKLKAEMKILEAKNRQLEIENEFIKNYMNS